MSGTSKNKTGSMATPTHVQVRVSSGEERDKADAEWLRSDARAREAEARYQGIFEATTDGLVINDMDGIAVEVNPAFCEMHGYTREELIGANLSMLHPPESQPVYWEYLSTTADGRKFMTQQQHIHRRKDGSQLFVEVRGSTFTYRGEPHILGVVRDVTDQVKAYELLEERVVERTQELSTLLDISNNMASILDLEPLLKRILDQLKFVAANHSASLVMQVGGEFVTIDTLGTEVPESVVPGNESPLEHLGLIWEALLAGESVIIPDVTASTPLAVAFRHAAGDMLDTSFSYIRSWLAVPLRRGEHIVGFLALSHTEPDAYTPRHAELVSSIANQAAIAIENARLYKQAQDTARITAALAQTGSRIADGGSLQSILDDICAHVVAATGASASAVLLVDEAPEMARMAGSHGLPDDYAANINTMIAAGVQLPSMRALMERSPVVIEREELSTLDPTDFASLPRLPDRFPGETLVAARMFYQDKPVGVLVGYYSIEHTIGEAEIAFHAAIADQAAVAVANARLLTQVQEKAASEQRRHLARELHDSVTQGLFSLNLIARSIEKVAEREGAQSEWLIPQIRTLRQLSQGALAEMRELIFELRPGALEEEGLVQAIRKHVAALQGREQLQIAFTVEEARIPRLKPAAEEALYRITQEALHNIVKHARATSVQVDLAAQSDFVVLQIKDDGVGFDVSSVPAGHMGLGTMGERTHALGGEYGVQSAAGQGTTVNARIPLSKWCLPD